METGYCIQLVLLCIWRMIHCHICPGKNPQTSFPPDMRDWVLSSCLGCSQARQRFSLTLQDAPSCTPLVPPTLGNLLNLSLVNSWLLFSAPIYLAHYGQWRLGGFNGVGWPGEGILRDTSAPRKEDVQFPLYYELRDLGSGERTMR